MSEEIKDTKLTGSICMRDIIAALDSGHPSITKAANGKLYVNVVVWLKPDQDQYGNNGSIQLTKPKDSTLPKVYIGNVRYAKPEAAAPPPTMDDIPDKYRTPF